MAETLDQMYTRYLNMYSQEMNAAKDAADALRIYNKWNGLLGSQNIPAAVRADTAINTKLVEYERGFRATNAKFGGAKTTPTTPTVDIEQQRLAKEIAASDAEKKTRADQDTKLNTVLSNMGNANTAENLENLYNNFMKENPWLASSPEAFQKLIDARAQKSNTFVKQTVEKPPVDTTVGSIIKKDDTTGSNVGIGGAGTATTSGDDKMTYSPAGSTTGAPAKFNASEWTLNGAGMYQNNADNSKMLTPEQFKIRQNPPAKPSMDSFYKEGSGAANAFGLSSRPITAEDFKTATLRSKIQTIVGQKTTSTARNQIINGQFQMNGATDLNKTVLAQFKNDSSNAGVDINTDEGWAKFLNYTKQYYPDAAAMIETASKDTKAMTPNDIMSNYNIAVNGGNVYLVSKNNPEDKGGLLSGQENVLTDNTKVLDEKAYITAMKKWEADTGQIAQDERNQFKQYKQDLMKRDLASVENQYQQIDPKQVPTFQSFDYDKNKPQYQQLAPVQAPAPIIEKLDWSTAPKYTTFEDRMNPNDPNSPTVREGQMNAFRRTLADQTTQGMKDIAGNANRMGMYRSGLRQGQQLDLQHQAGTVLANKGADLATQSMNQGNQIASQKFGDTSNIMGQRNTAEQSNWVNALQRYGVNNQATQYNNAINQQAFQDFLGGQKYNNVLSQQSFDNIRNYIADNNKYMGAQRADIMTAMGFNNQVKAQLTGEIDRSTSLATATASQKINDAIKVGNTQLANKLTVYKTKIDEINAQMDSLSQVVAAAMAQKGASDSEIDALKKKVADITSAQTQPILNDILSLSGDTGSIEDYSTLNFDPGFSESYVDKNFWSQ